MGSNQHKSARKSHLFEAVSNLAAFVCRLQDQLLNVGSEREQTLRGEITLVCAP